MASRRGKGFYRHLQEYSTANEWQALVSKRKRKPKATDSDVFNVESVLAERKRKGRWEFLVKWCGWSSQHNSWEPEAHFLDSRVIRNLYDHPSISEEEISSYSEILLNVVDHGLHQNLGTRITIDFPIKVFNFFFKGKGEERQRGTFALSKKDFSLCRFPLGWDKACINARGTERELLYPVLLRPFLSRSTQLYSADGSKRPRRWLQRLSISFRKHTV